jgi:hypothetical protein
MEAFTVHDVFNPLKTKRRPLYLKAQTVPTCTLFISVIKTNQFVVEVAQVAACLQINTKHINKCGQSVQLSIVKLVVHHGTSRL